MADAKECIGCVHVEACSMLRHLPIACTFKQVRSYDCLGNMLDVCKDVISGVTCLFSYFWTQALPGFFATSRSKCFVFLKASIDHSPKTNSKRTWQIGRSRKKTWIFQPWGFSGATATFQGGLVLHYPEKKASTDTIWRMHKAWNPEGLPDFRSVFWQRWFQNGKPK